MGPRLPRKANPGHPRESLTPENVMLSKDFGEFKPYFSDGTIGGLQSFVANVGFGLGSPSIAGWGWAAPSRAAAPGTAARAVGGVGSLGEVDRVTLQRLKLGADIEIPAGTKGIRTMMSDLTRVSGNEVALLRMRSGRRVLRMGGPKSVPLGRFVDRVIAHTHPGGRLKFSQADLLALRRLRQRSSVIIDPWADMGARLLVSLLGL
jgi:hypothetical protein